MAQPTDENTSANEAPAPLAPGEPADGAAKGGAVDMEAARAKASRSEDEASAAWRGASEAELGEEIEVYRALVRGLGEELKALGEDVALEDVGPSGEGDGDKAGPAPPEELQGKDYTMGSVDELDPSEWQVPPHCVPIHANVTTFDWSRLYNHAQFDVIMMDPPWQLATANPTRGVALGYSQLTDNDIRNLPIPKLQSSGFLFVWVINAKYKFCLDLFDHWGYRLVDEVVWTKMTVNRRMAKSHGFYLQHAKEVCLVAKKIGAGDPACLRHGAGSDIIYSERRGQSQKPEEVYELVEELFPGGKYLEIFARKNNLRNYWVSVGNEVTGTGLPDDDAAAVEAGQRIPGATYGKSTKG